jgi:uncharacterized membrane protein
MIVENVLLVIAGTLTALLAGLFFGYAVSVNGGLHRLKDSEYVAAMKSINVVILNPVFFLSFLGPVILLPWVTVLQIGSNPARFTLLLSASLVYVLGSFGLTIFGNVPLNRNLEKFDLSKATVEEIAEARVRFERPWNRLHLFRTIASIAATVLIFIACLSS